MPTSPLPRGCEHQQPLAPIKHDARQADEFFVAHGFADDGESLLRNLVVGHQVIGFIEVKAIDLGNRHEGFDVDRMRAFQRDLVEFVVLQLDVLVGLDLVALDPIFLVDRLAAFGVDDQIAHPVAGLLVDDVEPDAIARAGGGVERHRA